MPAAVWLFSSFFLDFLAPKSQRPLFLAKFFFETLGPMGDHQVLLRALSFQCTCDSSSGMQFPKGLWISACVAITAHPRAGGIALGSCSPGRALLGHTFSAFWLRSSVVSVLISLISDISSTAR